jgi:GTPase SAR1 family protein
VNVSDYALASKETAVPILFDMLKRPALGHAASLGSLYDARTDAFVSVNVFKRVPPTDTVSRTDIPSSEIKYSSLNTYKEKFSQFDIEPSLSASFLAGLFDVDGSGRYLTAKRDGNLNVEASLIYNLRTVNESINFQAHGLEDCLSLHTLDAGLATHVVAEIEWGSRNVITVKQSVSHTGNINQTAAKIGHQLSIFRSKFSSGGNFERAGVDEDLDNSFEVSVVGDINATDGLVPTDLNGARIFLSNMPKYVAAANDGKGKPLTYALLPISTLASLLKIEVSREIAVRQLSIDCAESFVQAFDELAAASQDLNDYRSLLLSHRDYISQDHIRWVGERISAARKLETKLKCRYAATLTDVRSGREDDSLLWKVLEEFTTGNEGIRGLAEIDCRPAKEKLQLINGLVNKGAKYIGFNFNGESIDLELGSFRDVDIYVFSFNEAARTRSEEWKQNISLLHQLLSEKSAEARFILKDCDASGENLVGSKISLFRNAEEVVDDVLEDRKVSAKRCIARYVTSHLDRSAAPKPPSRIIIRIPCPGPDCSLTACQDWVCGQCNTSIEYGHTDQYIYCDCGRCEYQYWSFRCSSRRHGYEYKSYDDSRLLRALSLLEPFEELNILILGRTGVGKSTWVNAFTNYLTFPTLDDALEADCLSWVIPFAFRTYNVNEETGEFEDIKVKVGFHDKGEAPGRHKFSVDEHDGTGGGSATQRTMVHRVQVGNYLLRLIDTPGIGDTRGASQDKENMADILSVLRSYQKLHGILILLKPNDQKLDLMFKFCVQELLTHLHRDAAMNLAFGFTNTRGTNYLPGDTFDPLRELLDRFKDVKISLRKHNVYCFDSESFRYLAAEKQHGKSLGHLDENRESWNYSVKESRRLIDYFKTLPPHHVTSTVNLYETRHRIVAMTEPMAAIAEAIRATIKVNEDQVRELSEHEVKKKDLEKLLKIQVKTLTAVRVSRPRTTCSHPDCVEHSSTGIEGVDRKDILTTVYKSMCHDPCYLNNVAVDQVGDAGLRGCWAMGGNNTCRVCHHPWMNHLHINYEIQAGTRETDDPEILDALRRNTSVRTQKQTAILSKKRLIEQLEFELKKFSDAAAQFSIFLKRNAIMPYNDATLEYLDRHIEDERSKVAVGGSRDKLDNLTQYKEQYQQQINILEEYMKKGEDQMLLNQAGVEMLVQDLYTLPHYGKALRDMGQVIRNVQTVVHREKPYVMRARSHWTGEEEAGSVTTSKTKEAARKSSKKNKEKGTEAETQALAQQNGGGFRGWVRDSLQWTFGAKNWNAFP